MNRSHAQFEVLAGAIALGEADAQARAAYAAHARSCPMCDEHVAERGERLAALVSDAAASETWRPFVRDALAARIERKRAASVTRIATLLGAGVVGTVALNVALTFAPGRGGPPVAANPDAASTPVVAAAAQQAPMPDLPALPIDRDVLQAAGATSGAAVTFVAFPPTAGPDTRTFR